MVDGRVMRRVRLIESCCCGGCDGGGGGCGDGDDNGGGGGGDGGGGSDVLRGSVVGGTGDRIKVRYVA